MADDQNQDASVDTDQPSGSEDNQQPEDSGLPAPETAATDGPPPEETPPTEPDQPEQLIGGRFRPDQVAEIDESVRAADRFKRELAETQRRLQQLEAERTQTQPKTQEERLENLRQQWEDGQITDEQYQDARIEIKAEQVVERRNQQSRLVTIQQKADATLRSSYPDFEVPGTEIHRATQEIVTNYWHEWGVNLAAVPSGSAIVKEALDARFGPRNAARQGALNEASRQARVGRAINGTDRSRPVGHDTGTKEIRFKPNVNEGDLRLIRGMGYDPNNQDHLRDFFKAASADVKARLLEDPTAV